MTNPALPLQPIMEELEKDLSNLERQWNDTIGALNVLRAKAGLPPRPGGIETTKTSGAQTDTASAGPKIERDTFFGKRMGTAAREYLAMRKAHGPGPATPREIFEALKAGGFQFEAKDDNISMVSLRAMLRKNTVTFTRIGNTRTYGLRDWYPGQVKPRGSSREESESDANESDDKKTADAKKASAA